MKPRLRPASAPFPELHNLPGVVTSPSSHTHANMATTIASLVRSPAQRSLGLAALPIAPVALTPWEQPLRCSVRRVQRPGKRDDAPHIRLSIPFVLCLRAARLRGHRQGHQEGRDHQEGRHHQDCQEG